MTGPPESGRPWSNGRVRARTPARWRVTHRANRVIGGSPEAQQILVRALGKGH